MEDIEWGMLETIIGRLVESSYRFSWVSLTGLGEPLMYPRILEAIKYIRSALPETPLKMNTNASHLRGDTARGLIGSGLDRLICSLNVVDSATFEKYKGLDYSQIESNIVEFLRIKGNRAPIAAIRVNAIDANLKCIGESRRFWGRHLNAIDRFSMGRFSNWAGKIDRAEFVSHQLTTPRQPCKFLFTEKVVAINLDGSVFPCCVAVAENETSPLYLGNIADNSLDELYQSETLAGLKSAHESEAYPSPCSECESWGAQVENLAAFRDGKLREGVRRIWSLLRS